MQRYEYRIVPAPARGTKTKGVKSPEGRFAHTLENLLNELAAEGWEFQRAEMLPSEERSGLTGTVTNWRNVLVFRRALAAESATVQVETDMLPVPVVAPVGDVPPQPEIPAPAGETPPEPPVQAAEETDPAEVGNEEAGDEEAEDGVIATPIPGPGAISMLKDNGVEEVSPLAGITHALKERAAQQQAEDEDSDSPEKKG